MHSNRSGSPGRGTPSRRACIEHRAIVLSIVVAFALDAKARADDAPPAPPREASHAEPAPEATAAEPARESSGAASAPAATAIEPAREASGAAPAPEAEAPEPSPDEEALARVERLGSMSLEALLDTRVTTTAGTLFERSSLEAPATIDVVTQSNFRLRASRRMLDAIDYLPSVITYPTIWGGDTLAIRGYSSVLSVRGIAVRLDDVPLNDFSFGTALFFASNLQLPTLERLDVVRGPGSSVYGPDAFHGTLSLRTFAPKENQVEGSGELGTDLFHRVYARTSQGLGRNFRVDTGVSYSGIPDQDVRYTFTDPTTGTVASSTRAASYRGLGGFATLRLEPPSGRYDASVAFYANDSHSFGAPGAGRGEGAISSLGGNDTSKGAAQLYVLRGKIGVNLPHRMRLEGMGYGWWNHGSFATNQDVFGFPAEATFRFADSRSGMRVMLRQEAFERIHTEWVLGFEYSRLVVGSGDSNTLQFLGSPTVTETPVAGAGAHRDINSLFLTAETRLAHDKVRLHYGGRVDWFSDLPDVASPRLGLVVMPRPDLALKVLYGRAYRPPAAQSIFGTPPSIAGSSSLRSETLGTVELVAMLERQKLRGGLTLFGSKWRDSIELVPNPMTTPGAPPLIYANSGENTAGGIETSFAYADRGGRLDLSASIVSSRNDTNDTTFSTFPVFIGNAGGGYKHDRARLELYLFLRILAGMTEAQPTPALPNPPRLPANAYMTLHVEWEAIPKHLDLFFDFRNVLGLPNRIPSLLSAEGGVQGPQYNVSIGLRARM